MTAARSTLFWLLAVLLGLANGHSSGASSQSWHLPDAVPVFRATEVQGQAWRKLADSGACLSQLGTLWCAASAYAYEHQDRLPQHWSDFTNDIAQPALLHCPADASWPTPIHWAEVDLASISYEILAPGADVGGASQSFLRCKVHGHWVTTHGTEVAARLYDGRLFPLAAAHSLWLPAPAFLTAREAASSVNCERNLGQLGFAASLFASDHGGFLPRSFDEMADTLDFPHVLVCPSDPLRTVAANFAQLASTNITYSLDAPGIPADLTPPERFLTCPIHGHQLRTDGSVVAGTNRYPPRLIIGHPLSWTVEPGRSVELAVLTGDPALGPFRYQWRRLQPFDTVGEPFTNTASLPGATNWTYAIPTASAADEGYYDVIVWDAAGGYQLSHPAYVRVEPLTNLHAEFTWEALACVNNLKSIGLAARMFTSASQDRFPSSFGDLPPYLGWPLTVHCPSDAGRSAPGTWGAVDFADLSYTLEPEIPSEPGTNVLASCAVHHYRVLADGTVHFGDTAPTIFRQPLSQATFAGRTVALRISTIGDRTSCQWFKDGQTLGGETNFTLTLAGVTVADAVAYHALVSNPWGSVASRVALLTVQPIPCPRLEYAVSGEAAEMTLSLAGPTGVECVLEASPDLRSWVALSTNLLNGGVFQYRQRIAPQPETRFYRALFR